MSGVNDIIKELDGLILSILLDSTTTKTTERRIGIIGFDVSINISPLVIPEQPKPSATRQSRPESTEPLIDVIEDKDTIRVIAALPGIRKDDVHYTVRENFLEIEIFAERVYKKKIPCSVRPDQISVKSTTVNNSVLELVFSKNAQKENST